MDNCFTGYGFLYDCDLTNSFINIYGETLEGVNSGDALVLPDHTKTAPDCVLCRVVFTPKEKAAALKAAEDLINNIEDLARLSERGELSGEADAVTGDRGLWEAYGHYVTPFGREGFDAEALDLLQEKWFEAGSYDCLTEEEVSLLGSYKAAARKTAQARVGKAPYAFETVIFAQRLFNLYTLKAPECVLKAEKQNLTRAFLIHRFAAAF